MISLMSRFEVVGPRELLWDALDALQDLGSCHLDPAPLELEGVAQKLRRPEFKESENTFRSRCIELDAQFQGVQGDIPAGLYRQEEDIAATSASLERRSQEELLNLAHTRLNGWRRIRSRIHNLQEDQKLFSKYQRVLDGIDRLQLAARSVVIPLLVDLDSSGQKELLTELQSLSKAPIERVSKKLGGGSFLLALAVSQESEAAVREYLWENKLSEVVFPSEYSNLTPIKVRSKIEDRLASIPDELDELHEEMNDYLADFGVELISVGNILADHVARYEACAKASVSKYAFQLVGWIPLEEFSELEERIQRLGDGVVGIQKIPFTHDDVAPTKLSNPGFARPFQTLLGIFPPPSAGSIDPTVTLVLTFPLFFGYMVGDAGYGFFMLLFALAIRFLWAPKVPILKDVSYIFGLAALSATFFGVLFGEYFGHLGVFVATKMGLTNLFHGLDPANPWHGHLHLWIGRTEEYLPRYLAYSCILGVLHMGTSLLFGIYTALGHYKVASEHGDELHMKHSLSHALEKIAMFASLIGFLLVAIGGIVPDLAYVGQSLTTSDGLLQNAGTGLIIASVLMLIYALPGMQKLTAPVEGVAILSNTISYSRLMAVGVAGVVLANIANDLGRLGFVEGTHLGITFACIVGAFLLHVGALFIAIFDPLVQALRLHYVEFFGKFFESEGMNYAPLARKGGSSL
jgi:V/A-type H+-transporting ATPase subunit I